MWAAMKSTAETSSGWSSQTFQISPVVTGTLVWRFTLRISSAISSALFSPRKMVSLPTTNASTLEFCLASPTAFWISSALRVSSLSIQAPTDTFRPRSEAIEGISSRPPVEE